MPDDQTPAPKSSVLPTVLTVAGLILLLAFVGRVVYFMNAIHKDGADPSGLSFKSQFTALRNLPPAPAATTATLARTDVYALGSPSAPVQVVEFADFGCPYSKASADVVRVLAQKYPDKVRIAFRHFPIDDLHPNADHASLAAECAGDQGKFWEYHDKLFLNQQDIGDDALKRYATELNLDEKAFDACFSTQKYLSRVKTDMEAGAALGIGGTPTFFFNGIAIPGAIPEKVFEQLIQTLAKSS